MSVLIPFAQLGTSALGQQTSERVQVPRRKRIFETLRTRRKTSIAEEFPITSVTVPTLQSSNPIDTLTLKLWAFPMQLAQLPLLWSFPFHFVHEPSSEPRIIRVRHYKFYVTMMLMVITLKCAMVWKMFHFLATEDLQNFYQELFHSLFVTLFFTLATLLQLDFLSSVDNLQYFANSILKLFLDSRENVWEAKLIMFLMNVSCLPCCPAIGIGEYIMIKNGLFWQAFKSELELVNIGFAVFLIWLITYEFSILMFYPFTCLINMVLVGKCLTSLERTPSPNNLSTSTHNQHNYYRSHQILNIIANEAISRAVAIAIGFLTILVTFSYTTIIKFHMDITPLFSIACGIIGLVCNFGLAWIVHFSVRSRKSSLAYIESNLKNEHRLSTYEKKFLQSCFPIQYKVGQFFDLTSRRVILEILSFIASSIVNLLVYLKDV